MKNFNYENFKALKNQILAAIDTISEVSREFGRNGDLQKMGNICDRLKDEKFKVLVVGEFKRGKSTLINSLLGEKILPAKVAPCTAVITEIMFREEPMAIVYFKDKDKPPLQVGVDRLEKTLKETIEIKHTGMGELSSQVEAVRQSPYEKATLFYPIKLCQNGVMIIDSPGLNEDITREAITKNYMVTTDVAVLVLGCDMFIDTSEIKFLRDDLKRVVYDNLFVVANRADVIEDENDWRDIKNRAIEYLSPLLAQPFEGRLFFCSAKNALNGKLKNDTLLIEQSGVPQFETALEEYLVKFKTKVKIENPIFAINEVIGDYERKEFDNRLKLLSQSLEVLEQKRKEVSPKFQEAEERKQRMLQLLANRKMLILQTMLADVRSFVYELERKEIDFIKKYQFKDFSVFSPRKSIEDDLLPATGEYFGQEVDKFIKDDLVPKIQHEIEQAILELHEDAKKFEKLLDDIRITFNPDYEVNTDEKEIGAIERIFAAAGGLFLGGIGSATVGGTLGFKAMLKSFLPNVAVGLTMVLLGINPLLILPMLLALGIYQIFKGSKGMQDALKQKVAEQIPNVIRDKRPELEKNITKAITETLDGIRNTLADGLDNMINNIKNELDKVIEDKKNKEAELEQEKRKIEHYRTQFTQIRSQMEEILRAFPA